MTPSLSADASLSPSGLHETKDTAPTCVRSPGTSSPVDTDHKRTDRSSLPEVVGEAGCYFDPTDVDSIADAIRGLLAEPGRREALARRALERSKLFTWDASARALLDCLAELEPGYHRESALHRTA